MLSRFHRATERDRQTDGRTDRQNYYIRIARQCAEMASVCIRSAIMTFFYSLYHNCIGGNEMRHAVETVRIHLTTPYKCQLTVLRSCNNNNNYYYYYYYSGPD